MHVKKLLLFERIYTVSFSSIVETQEFVQFNELV